MKESKIPSFLLEHTPWEEENNPIWLASSFILHRNLTQYPFPPKLNEKTQANQVLEKLKETLLRCPELKEPLFLKGEECSALDKEFLFEHFLRLEAFPQAPLEQGFLIDKGGCFLGLCNMSDHLQLQLLDCRGEWEMTWNALLKIETALAAAFDYAYSPRFGYLTADIGHCGTGLEVLLYLHLPALIHKGQLEEILQKQKEEDVLAIGMEGALDQAVGDFVILRNRYNLGVSEEAILRSLQTTAMKIIGEEKTLRTHLKETSDLQIKDLISRAYGLLFHSYQLQTRETLEALSHIKLGLYLGWVTGTTDKKINQAFFACRRAHLIYALKEESSDYQELPRKRAEFLQKELQGMQLPPG